MLDSRNAQGSLLMNDERVLIRCENVGKKYCRSLKQSLLYGINDIASDLMGRRSFDDALRSGEFWANRGIDFELERGQCLGLIGHNGAGKTTLLKMLNGLIKPDTGSITITGEVHALIALGAGFNPILTGRENVFVNGCILGLSRKQIQNQFDEIVEFAELSDFIDSPIRNYSSGMQVRLGFAIAAILMQPDILLLDEVLAVGDASFQVKCVNVIRNLQRNGVAICLVSHSMQNILRFCDRGIYLSNGEIKSIGDIREVSQHYQIDAEVANRQREGIGNVEIGSPLRLGPVVWCDDSGLVIERCESTSRILLEIPYWLDHPLEDAEVTAELLLTDSAGIYHQSFAPPFIIDEDRDRGYIRIAIEALCTASSRLLCDVAIWDRTKSRILAWTRDNEITVISEPTAGRVLLDTKWSLSRKSIVLDPPDE